MAVTSSMEYRVPYADTDQMGVVYYANYLIYFEMGRAELLRSIGYSYSRLENEMGCALPVIEAVCKYKNSAHFEDLLTITVHVGEIKGVRLRIDAKVTRGDELLAEGYTWHVCMNLKNERRLMKIPEILANLA